jgi:hypothetical protein
MPLVSVAALVAMTVAAPPSGLRDIAHAALAPPPETAVLQTETFGTITLDHSAHLARRTACKACHGPGPVTKLGRLPPKVAHDRCVTCHRTAEAGPTGCKDCHVKPAPAPGGGDAVTTASMSDVAAGASAEATVAAASSAAAAPAPALAALDAELTAMKTREIEDRVRNPFRRILSLGVSSTGGGGRDVTTGPALYVTAREGKVMVAYGIEHGTFSGDSRTLGLIGGGITHQLRGPWNVHGLGVGGFDVIENPTSFSPILGVRSGIEWLGRTMSVSLDGSALVDLMTQTDKLGQEYGGLNWSVSLSVGFVISRD